MKEGLMGKDNFSERREVQERKKEGRRERKQERKNEGRM